MNKDKLVSNLEDRLRVLRSEYNKCSEYDQFNDTNDSCYERNRVASILPMLELKSKISELERILKLLKD